MRRGKQTCRILKEIRRQIAVANDIEFITSECQFQGDCLGTCPKCESEVRYLEQQLERKQITGKAITVLGISAGVIAAASLAACGSSSSNKGNEENVMQDSITIPITDEQPPLLGNPAPPKDSIKVKATTIGFVPPVIDAVVGEVAVQDTIDIADVMPKFPGGNIELMNFINANLIFPQELTQEKKYGQARVIVEITIDKKGNIVQSKILRGVHPLLDKEALRVVQLMPKWKPGLINDQPVISRYTFPCIFKIQ